MRSQQIRLALDKRGEAIEFTSSLWSSDQQPWSGLPAEVHQIGPKGYLREFRVKNTLVGLCIGGHASVTIGRGAARRRFGSEPGRIIVLGPHYEYDHASWSGNRRTLYVDVDPRKLTHLVPDDGEFVLGTMPPHFGIVDPQLTSLMVNMQREIIAGCPGGRLYSESLSLAFTTYLFARYSARRRQPDRPAYQLSKIQLRRVREYISENLSRNLTITELAQVAALSPHYFSCLFKNTVGTTPHQYVLRQRINVGRKLLANNWGSISAIALEVGFANQSHFTDAFRKVTGITPKQYQRNS